MIVSRNPAEVRSDSCSAGQDNSRQIATFTVRLGWRNQYCGLLKADIDGVIYYLIDNEFYFKRGGLYGYGDDAERFIFFCYAVMEAVALYGFSS